MGPDRDHLCHVGVLTCHLGEWQLFGATLLAGSRVMTDLAVSLEGREQVIAHFAKEEDALADKEAAS